MKLFAFSKLVKLTDLEQEVLRVAMLESLANAESQQQDFEQNSKEFAVLDNKKQLLKGIAQKLGLIYD